jgi:hypothetical protein
MFAAICFMAVILTLAALGCGVDRMLQDAETRDAGVFVACVLALDLLILAALAGKVLL